MAYFSNSTDEVEQKFHSFELETLAVVKAIERFHVYLLGIPFKVVTDCNALIHAFKKINIDPRTARWSFMLQNYNFTIEHRGGERMKHVDALSRMIMFIEPIKMEHALIYRQLSDENLKDLAEQLEFTDDKKFQLIKGLIYRNYRNEVLLFVVPDTMVNNVIRLSHDEKGHVGIDKTVFNILQNYWFTNLKMKIKDYIDNCLVCLSHSMSAGKPEGS